MYQLEYDTNSPRYNLKNVLSYVMYYYIFLNEFHLNQHDTILMIHTYQFTVNTTERRSLEYYNMLNNLSATIITI